MNNDERDEPERIYIHPTSAEYHLSRWPLEESEYTEYVRADLAATRIREACVKMITAQAKRLESDRGNCAMSVRIALYEAIGALESLTLDQVEEKQRRRPMNETRDQSTEDYAYSVRLATVLRDRYYPDVQDWQPLPTLSGVLSQIDNMIAGLPNPAEPSRVFRIQEATGPF